MDRAADAAKDAHNIEFFAFALLNIPMANMKHPSARGGFLLTVARVALRQLAMESGQKFAAYIAWDALFPKRWQRLASFLVPFFLVGGVLQYLEILVRFLWRITN